MMAGPRVVSLFTGCGGLDLGFEAAGFRTITMVDISSFACKTLRQNFPRSEVVGPPYHTGDVRRLDTSLIVTQPDVVLGGPPCQSFSVAAAQRFLKGDRKFKRVGFDDPERGTLIHDFVRVTLDLAPRVFLLENVPGLVALDSGRTLGCAVDQFRAAGYQITGPLVLQAAAFGVPQLRQRLFLLGCLDRKLIPPTPEYAAKHSLKTVAEALHRISPLAANHEPRRHKTGSIERYRRLAVGQREHLGRVDRLDPMKPSKTVIAGGSNGGGRSHLHPFLARTLTVRESARLQTFPDDFIFYGTMGRQFTQVGNAVPPLLAEVLARAIGEQAFGLRYRHPPRLRISAPTPETCARLLLQDSLQYPDLCYRDLLSGPAGALPNPPAVGQHISEQREMPFPHDQAAVSVRF
jgi:DNA (cytosine-5)-methyltransferase 1